MGRKVETWNRGVHADRAEQARRIFGPVHGSMWPRARRAENETRGRAIAKCLNIIRVASLDPRGDPQGEEWLPRFEFAGRGTMYMLPRSSQFVAIALAVVIPALPLSACLTSAANVSQEQRECCQKMAGRCETSVMPSSHSCCQHPVSRQDMATSKVQRNDAGSAVAMVAEGVLALPQLIVRSSSTSFESPPESPPQIVNVLRI